MATIRLKIKTTSIRFQGFLCEQCSRENSEYIYDTDVNKSRRQAVLGRQDLITTPWLTERHGYDPTLIKKVC